MRKKMDIFQEELALRINTTQSYISRIERNIHIPNIENFIKIARAIGVEPTDLLKSVLTSN